MNQWYNLIFLSFIFLDPKDLYTLEIFSVIRWICGCVSNTSKADITRFHWLHWSSHLLNTIKTFKTIKIIKMIRHSVHLKWHLLKYKSPAARSLVCSWSDLQNLQGGDPHPLNQSLNELRKVTLFISLPLWWSSSFL